MPSLPVVGRPGDLWWLFGPLPLLAGVAVAAWMAGPVAEGHALQALLVLNFLHVAATWTRLYARQHRAVDPVGAYALPAALLAAALGLVGSGHGTALLFLVFLCNIPHIGLQNYGFVRIAERRAGPDASPWDPWLDKATLALVPTWLAVWFCTRPNADLFDSRSLGLDAVPPAALLVVGVPVGLVAAVTWGRLAWLATTRRPPTRERLFLHLGWGPGALACFALLPASLAALPLAGAHYVQYLVFVRRFHQAAAARGGPSVWARLPWPLWILALGLLAPGIPLAVDLLLAPVLGDLLVAVGSAASLHHFIVDGRLWRLRSRAVASVALAA